MLLWGLPLKLKVPVEGQLSTTYVGFVWSYYSMLNIICKLFAKYDILFHMLLWTNTSDKSTMKFFGLISLWTINNTNSSCVCRFTLIVDTLSFFCFWWINVRILKSPGFSSWIEYLHLTGTSKLKVMFVNIIYRYNSMNMWPTNFCYSLFFFHWLVGGSIPWPLKLHSCMRVSSLGNSK